MIHTLSVSLHLSASYVEERMPIMGRASSLEIRIDLRRAIDLGWEIPRVDQTAVAGPVGILDLVATTNHRLEECAGVAVVVRWLVKSNSLINYLILHFLDKLPDFRNIIRSLAELSNR